MPRASTCTEHDGAMSSVSWDLDPCMWSRCPPTNPAPTRVACAPPAAGPPPTAVPAPLWG
eukprot:1763578-Prymnesium_polylepis.1